MGVPSSPTGNGVKYAQALPISDGNSPYSRTRKSVRYSSNGSSHHSSTPSGSSDVAVESNWNVRLALAYGALQSASSSLFGQTNLAAYINLITDDNDAKVGLLTGLQGAINLGTAVVVAPLLDKGVCSREAALRLAGVLGFTVVITGLCHCLYTRHVVSLSEFYYIFGTTFLCYGTFQGMTSATLESLFADSIPSGNRSRVYTFRSMLRTAGNAMGPLVAVVIFLLMTNDWTDFELRIVMCVGFSLFSLPCLLLFFFRESSTLGHESESLLIRNPDRPDRYLSDEEDCPDVVDAENAVGGEGATPPAEVEAGSEEDEEEPRHKKFRCGCFTIPASYIPGLVALSDALSMLGSGITIRFFPIFFWRKVGFKPVAVNAIYVGGPLGISLCAFVAQKLSVCFGRPQIAFCCKLLAAGLLVSMAFIENKPLLVAVYFIRTWSANCTAGLTRSMLNDYVSKAARARWNAVESINSFTWSGSALIGGVIIERLGFYGAFVITASLQVMAGLLLLPLFSLVRPEQESYREESKFIKSAEPPAEEYLASEEASEVLPPAQHGTGCDLKQPLLSAQ